MDRKERAEIILEKLKELYPDPEVALNYSTTFELLVAVILSARSTDKKINEVTKDLFQKYTSIEDYAQADLEELYKDLYSTGFYKSKSKYVKGAAQKILDDFDREVPNSMEDLTKLPGVSRKTANVVLAEAFDKNEGIPVDTHVKRLSNKFDLTDSDKPDKIEKDLMEVIPQDEWGDFALRLILYGREYSPAHKKDDDSDPISQALKKGE